jgi:hypothetical protein
MSSHSSVGRGYVHASVSIHAYDEDELDDDNECAPPSDGDVAGVDVDVDGWVDGTGVDVDVAGVDVDVVGWVDGVDVDVVGWVGGVDVDVVGWVDGVDVWACVVADTCEEELSVVCVVVAACAAGVVSTYTVSACAVVMLLPFWASVCMLAVVTSSVDGRDVWVVTAGVVAVVAVVVVSVAVVVVSVAGVVVSVA